jgi:predicted phosphodiesterase
MRHETNTDIARRYREQYGPEMSNLKLARIMYNENKLSFSTVEAARTRLRYIEGKLGETNRIKAVAHSKYFMKEARPYNPYKLPESDEEPYEPYFIKGHKRVLVINDVHIPYHSIQAITAAFDYAKKEKPDAVFVNGDMIDNHQLSYFLKDPRKKNFAVELAILKDFFERLQKVFKCKIYYKFGNHEERYESYLFQKAKELVGVEEFEFENIIKARAQGIEIVKDKRLVVMNGLPFVHGHEFGRMVFSPVNAGRGLFLQAINSAVKGDCHTTSEHVQPNIFGKIFTTWSVGCLCGLHPKWLPINKWNTGFALVDLDKNGSEFQFRNYRIYKGKVL